MDIGSWLPLIAAVSPSGPSPPTPPPVVAVAAGDYWFALLAFAVGGLAGFQAIYNRYGPNSPALATVRTGLVYLGIRGAPPAILFCIALGHTTIPVSILALCLGVSTEAFLRLTFFIAERQQPNGPPEPILAGPFDLLKWYQNLVLDKLLVDLGDLRKEAVEKLIPKHLTFDALCTRIEDRLGAYENLRQAITAAIAAQRAAFAADPMPPGADKDIRFKARLGYALLMITERRVVNQLVT
jgi:hypothetical protein